MIFVFGSNLAGRHGAGAALYARRKYGAEHGVGIGRTGDAYALPTKDEQLRTLSLEAIEGHVRNFCRYAAEQHHEAFLVTPIGCGLAGYSRDQIAPMFARHGLTSNVFLSHHWITDARPTPSVCGPIGETE